MSQAMSIEAKIESFGYEAPDWAREKPRNFWDPSRKLLGTIRSYQALKKCKNPLAPILSKFCVLRYRFWSAITGAEIDLMCSIGGGLLIPHPNGIVIHPNAVIGNNCLIFQQVTLTGETKLGHHVDIGAGAKIIGPLTINSFSTIGASSVVTKDVESHQTIVGIPGRPIALQVDS